MKKKRRTLKDPVTITLEFIPANTKRFQCNHWAFENEQSVDYGHRFKDGEKAYYCGTPTRYGNRCGALVCEEHKASHDDCHILERLADAKRRGY